MIEDSYSWKQDLARRKAILKKNICASDLDENIRYICIEKSIFYSAFIIRKLLDCHVKLSNKADAYKVIVKVIEPLKNINVFNRNIDDNSHNWVPLKHPNDNSFTEHIAGRKICDQLIHSMIFSILDDENGNLLGFIVASDRECNSKLYFVGINTWLEYMDYIIHDNIVELQIECEPETRKCKLRKKRYDDSSRTVCEGN